MLEQKEIFSCCSALTEYVTPAAEPPQSFVPELSKNWSESFRAVYNVTTCLQAWVKVLLVKEDIEEKEYGDIASDIVTKLEMADVRLHRGNLNITTAWLTLLT